MSSNNAPVLVLLSRSIRLISMQLVAAGSLMSPARITVAPPPASTTRSALFFLARCALKEGRSSGLSRSSKLPVPSSSGCAAAAAGRGRGGSASASFSASASSSAGAAAADAAAPRPPPEGTLITSPSNPFVKYCAKLRTSPAARSEAGATLLAGDTIISEVCRGGSGRGSGGENGRGGGRGGGAAGPGPLPPRVLFLAPGADAPEGCPRALLTLRAPAEVLSKLAGLATTARGSASASAASSLTAVAVVDLPREATFRPPSPTEAERGREAPPPPPSSAALVPPPLPRRLLALDGVQDPGNVGTLARSALALGWDGMYCLPGTADPWGDKALRAARGAAWRLPVRGGGRGGSRGGGASSWDELVEVARGAGLDFLVAEPRAEEGGGGGGGWPPSAPGKREGHGGGGRGICLVLGSEGSGLSAEGRAALLASCGGSSSSSSSSPSSPSNSSVSSVSIPMSGEMESLNVATAGAVLMFALGEGAADFVRGLEKR